MIESESDKRSSSEELPPRLQWAASSIVWIAASSLIWCLVLLLAGGLLREGGPGGVLSAIPLALRYSALMSLPVAVAHLVAALLRQRGANWLPWSAVAIAALLTYPAYSLADFLCSGDWISTQPWAPILKVALLFFTWLAIAAAWIWHSLLVPDNCRELFDSKRLLARLAGLRGGIAAPTVLGAAVGGVGLVVAANSLEAYVLLAQAITAGSWFAAATLGYSAVRRFGSPKGRLLVLGVLWSMGGAALAIADAVREPTVPPRSGRIASLVLMTVTWRPPATTRFDISNPSTFDCTKYPAKVVLSLPDMTKSQRRNVILIFIDALRADALTERRGDRPLTPNLQAFARESRRFERAMTTYPATLFAMASALTGRSPSDVLLAPEIPPNLLALGKGVFDEIYVSIPDNTWFRLPAVDSILLQGVKPERLPDAAAQTARAIEVLSETRAKVKRTLMWLHYYEPHMPYVVHKGYELGPGPRNAYLSEVAFVDNAIGPLFVHLARTGWYEDSLVVVAADHGQALGERGYWGHHVYLTNPLTAIPLFVRAPELAPGVSKDLVTSADIGPTAMHFAGMPVPVDAAGRSLLARRPTNASMRTVVAEAFPLRGLRLFDFAAMRLKGLDGLKMKIQVLQTNLGSFAPKAALVLGRHRLIVDRVTGSVALYDDLADPTNETNVASRYPDLVAAMISRLSEWHAKASARAFCNLLREP